MTRTLEWTQFDPLNLGHLVQQGAAAVNTTKRYVSPWGRAFVVVAAMWVSLVTGEAAAAGGPLRVHPTNPCCFTDGTTTSEGSPKAIYLTGSHQWNNLQDSGRLGAPLTNRFDFDDYLKRLQGWNHNIGQSQLL